MCQDVGYSLFISEKEEGALGIHRESRGTLGPVFLKVLSLCSALKKTVNRALLM